MNGEGVYVHRDGREYRGQYRNDMKEGHGTYSWPSGSAYEGQWHEDRMHGMGKHTSTPTNDQYTGGFDTGERHGHGVLCDTATDKKFDVTYLRGQVRRRPRPAVAPRALPPPLTPLSPPDAIQKRAGADGGDGGHRQR